MREANLEAMIAEHPSPGEFVKPAWLDGIGEDDEETDGMEAADEEPPFQLPDVTSEDEIDWEVVIDSLTDAVLWGDGDYDMDAAFLDASPARKKVLAQQLGIDEEYFLGIAPDPTEQELEEIRSVLRRILGREGALAENACWFTQASDSHRSRSGGESARAPRNHGSTCSFGGQFSPDPVGIGHRVPPESVYGHSSWPSDESRTVRRAAVNYESRWF